MERGWRIISAFSFTLRYSIPNWVSLVSYLALKRSTRVTYVLCDIVNRVNITTPPFSTSSGGLGLESQGSLVASEMEQSLSAWISSMVEYTTIWCLHYVTPCIVTSGLYSPRKQCLGLLVQDAHRLAYIEWWEVRLPGPGSNRPEGVSPEDVQTAFRLDMAGLG